MNIDEAKTQLIMQKFYVLGNDYEAIEVALDTMQKYQKIMDIVMNGDDTHYALLMQIKEIIENGSN